MNLTFLVPIFIYIIPGNTSMPNTTLVWIQHPRIKEYYEHLQQLSTIYKRQRLSDISKVVKRIKLVSRGRKTDRIYRASSIKKLSILEKQNLCNSKTVLFSMIQDNDTFPDLEQKQETISGAEELFLRQYANWPIENTESVNKILYRDVFMINLDYMNNLTTTKKDYTKIPLQVGTNIDKTKALPCVIYEDRHWYIADGFFPSVYFTAEKNTKDEFFKLTGLLVPAATIQTRYLTAPKRLERDFRDMQAFIVQTKKKVKLCRLDSFHQFKLCSVVYSAWQQHHQPTSRRKWHLMKNFNKTPCIEDVILISRLKPTVWVSDIAVDLLPCAVDEEEPAFYVTAHEGGSRSAYIVEKRKNEGDYVLSTSVIGIPSLSNAEFENLRIDYLHPV